MNGVNGAMTSVTILRQSCSVSERVGIAFQKRRRERLTYQLFRSSTYSAMRFRRVVSNWSSAASTSRDRRCAYPATLMPRWTNSTHNAPENSSPNTLTTLSNWYVRRSRGAFWEGDPNALVTLAISSRSSASVMAPFTPFIAERVWSDLFHHHIVDAANSVHLAASPDSIPSLIDDPASGAGATPPSSSVAAHAPKRRSRHTPTPPRIRDVLGRRPRLGERRMNGSCRSALKKLIKAHQQRGSCARWAAARRSRSAGSGRSAAARPPRSARRWPWRWCHRQLGGAGERGHISTAAHRQAAVDHRHAAPGADHAAQVAGATLGGARPGHAFGNRKYMASDGGAGSDAGRSLLSPQLPLHAGWSARAASPALELVERMLVLGSRCTLGHQRAVELRHPQRLGVRGFGGQPHEKRPHGRCRWRRSALRSRWIWPASSGLERRRRLAAASALRWAWSTSNCARALERRRSRRLAGSTMRSACLAAWRCSMWRIRRAAASARPGPPSKARSARCSAGALGGDRIHRHARCGQRLRSSRGRWCHQSAKSCLTRGGTAR